MERAEDNVEELVTTLERDGDRSTLNEQAQGEVEEDCEVCVQRQEQAQEVGSGRMGVYWFSVKRRFVEAT